jgi:hypothetical protein
MKTAIFLAFASGLALANENPLCWAESDLVHYHKYNEEKTCEKYISENFKIEKIEFKGKMNWQVKSSLGYGFAKEVRKDSAIVVVGTGDKYMSKITATNSFTIENEKWVNENIIYFRIWIGRIRACDIYFDSENRSLAFYQNAVDGDLIRDQYLSGCKSHPAGNAACSSRCE